MEELNFEDREIVALVVAEAWPKWSRTQRDCLLLLLLGLTQEQAAGVVGINRKAVSYHFRRALRNFEEIGKQY